MDSPSVVAKEPAIFGNQFATGLIHAVIDCITEILLASEITLGGVDGDMSEQQLDLIQFAAGQVAQSRASATQVVRGKFLNARRRGGLPDNLPGNLRSHPVTPDSAGLVDRSDERTFSDTAALLPYVDRLIHPPWNGNSTEVTGLPEKPAMTQCSSRSCMDFDVQAEQFAAAKSVSDQHGEDRLVPLATERIAVRTSQKAGCLARR